MASAVRGSCRPAGRLLVLGLTTSDLRWPVTKGYAAHGRELTTACDTTRRFRPARNLAFGKRTCFVLTDAGAAYLAGVLGEGIGPRLVAGAAPQGPPSERMALPLGQ